MTNVTPRSSYRLGLHHLRTTAASMTIVTALALGGAHVEVNAVVATIIVALAVAMSWRRPGSLAVGVPVLAGLAALGMALLQLVPLPTGLVSILSPGADGVLAVSVPKDVSLTPLSLDPPATAHEVLKLAAIVGAGLLALGLFGDRERRRELVVWISLAGAVVAGLGFVHMAAGLDRPWGTFGDSAQVFTSSFVNPNHLAGFLGFCGTLSLGLALTSRGSVRWAHLANAVLVGAALLLTASRGGILAFLFGLLLLSVLFWIAQSERLRRLVWLQVGLAGILFVASSLGHMRIVHEFWKLGGGNAFKKLAIWGPVPEMVADFPVLGAGRGAFVAVYPRYRPNELPATFTHLENEWLQTIVDFGPLPALILLAGLGLTLFLILRQAQREPLANGVAAALCFLAIHNTADFNLELTAVAMPAMMVAAVFARSARGTVGVELPANAARILAALLVLVVLACALPAVFHELRRDTDALREALARHGKSAEWRAKVAAEITRHHPADYLLPLLIAERELRGPHGARRALRWVNRGLYLAPGYSGGHRLAGRALLRLGVPGQALMEYRLACVRAPRECGSIADEVWLATGGDAGAVSSLATGPIEVRSAVARLLIKKSEPTRALDALGPEDSVSTLEALELAALAHEKMGNSVQVVRWGRRLEEEFPGRPNGYLAQAKALQRRGETKAALAVLDRGIARADSSQVLLFQKARLFLSIGEIEKARETATKLLERAASARWYSRAYWLIGQVQEREGRKSWALRSYERARESDPGRVQHWTSIARVRRDLGDADGARTELQNARAKLGAHPLIERQLRRLEIGQ